MKRLAPAVLAAALLAVPAAAAAAPPQIAGCPVLPANNIWNTPIDRLPSLGSTSDGWVNTMGRFSNFHPDFGTFYLGAPIGIPFVTVPGTQPAVPVTFEEPDESDPGPYPIPPDAPIEGGPDSDGDRHILVIDRGNCILYETFYSFPDGSGGWTAFSGAKFDLRSNALRPDTWTSADAAGLPIFPGLVRYDEVIAGEINHALRFTTGETRASYVWPARHEASDLVGSQYPPMGARFRLKAGFDISGFSPRNQVILRALKKYGMILADNGSAWYVSGEHNPNWDDDELSELKSLEGDNFEAVDTSSLQVQANSGQAFTPPPAVTLREVALGLASPVGIANAADGSGRLFVVEQGGYVRIVKNGSVLPTPFLNATTLTVGGGERGLLGLAFHPQFATNRRFFVAYTQASGGALRVSSFMASPVNPDVADPASELEIITIAHPGFANHNGGHIAFGPDGYLYIGTGDGGGTGDPGANAQDLGERLGKMLRINVHGATGYVVPPNNPFVATAGAMPEIWAYGLRNPWRFSFDRIAGDLYIGDVGQGEVEEIDFQAAGASGGRNYGWRVFEGTTCYNPPTGCSLPNHTPPVVQYGHVVAGGFSVTGGYVYRGAKSAALRGYYLYGDFGTTRIWAAQHVGSTWNTSVLVEPPSVITRLSAFGEDELGEVYVASYDDGKIYAIDGPGPRVRAVRQDFNGDAKSDVLWRDPAGAPIFWHLNGATITEGQMQVMGTATLTVSASFSVVGVGDFNGDGKADILLRNPNSGSNVIWHLDGSVITAGKVKKVSTGSLPSLAADWTVIGTGDFNGDGKSDILWRDPTGVPTLWNINGAAITAGQIQILSQGTLSLSTGFTVQAIGDFNGDGKADVLWRKESSGSNRIWHLDGAIITSGKVRVLNNSGLQSLASTWSISGVGDFNGDGKSDLLWRDPAGQGQVWHLNGASLSGGQVQVISTGTVSTAAGFMVAGVGDYNGDGFSDVLFRNPTSGSNRIWHLNGNIITAGKVRVLSAGNLPSRDNTWTVVNPR